MREFIVDFTADVPIVPGTVIGRQGENNATALKIKIPDEILNNEAVELISLAAQIGAGHVARSELIAKAETVTVKLDSRMTAVNSLSVQLEGYDSTKSLLVKSAKIDNLIFDKSVTGETPELEGNAGVIADIAANTSARHTHENAETLNKLGDSNGSLTYDGKAVGGRQTATVELDTTEFYTDSMNGLHTAFIINNTLKIPESAEITAIEINTASNENPVWTDLRDMIYKEPFSPYYVNFCKMKYCEDYEGYLICYLYFLYSSNSFQSNIASGQLCGIKVTYYV